MLGISMVERTQKQQRQAVGSFLLCTVSLYKQYLYFVFNRIVVQEPYEGKQLLFLLQIDET